MKKLFLFTLLYILCTGAQAQVGVSLATDFSFLRSFTPDQRFWAYGQTVMGQWHFSNRQSLYASINYYSPGHYKNTVTSTAKDSLTSPQSIESTVRSEMRYRQVSLGWKHYFKGGYNTEESWNLYGLAGFGLLMAQVSNDYDQPVDTALYAMPQKAIPTVESRYRKLTFDAGLGMEVLLGSSIYLYSDLRTWIPASSTQSPYLYNNNAPRTLSLNAGLRVLFQ